MRTGNRGVSLAEFLIATFLSLVIMGSIYWVLSRGVTLQDQTAKGIDLLVQSRTVLENLARDVHGALQFMAPEGGAREIVLVKDLNENAGPRLELSENDPRSTAYPFLDPSATTTQRIPAVRVRYVHDTEARTITRVEEAGTLDGSSDAQAVGLLCRWTFQVDGGETVGRKVMARNVGRFEWRHVAVDRLGRPRLIADLTPGDFLLKQWVGDEAAFRHAQTAWLFVRLTALFDQGVYGVDPANPQPGKKLKAEVVDLCTKVVCYKRLVDAREREWFSSADEDLRY